MINLFLILYTFVWHLSLPFLKCAPRVALGWNQRTLKDIAEGPFDLWIQSASGGESLLTNMVLKDLETLRPGNKKLRVLVTSGTKQGIDSLEKGQKSLTQKSSMEITVAYFPFDTPALMNKAFNRFKPKLAIIVETELWPGFLITATKKDVPVILINGRMSEKSFGSYRYFRKFFKKFGPEKVLAISPVDGDRFSRIVGEKKVSLINNIKFDRIEPQVALPGHSPIADLLPEKSPFVLLGSIRREEEDKILSTVANVLVTRPNITIGIFPKHIERANSWLELLKKKNIAAVKRSATHTRLSPGTVIVWDIFGELAGAYALADAAFVGGSLVNLGGQNFLEPLVFGLKPIIGPYWKNFAWVGREIVASGLVQEVVDEKQLVNALLSALDADQSRDEVIKQVRDFFEPRKGGTQQVCRQIIDTLKDLEKR
ncbi:MAG: glycosyltransferase N-terminal domain-containing protein [Desulforhopalus sp.]